MSHIPSSAIRHAHAKPGEDLSDPDAVPGEAPVPEPTAHVPPAQPPVDPVVEAVEQPPVAAEPEAPAKSILPSMPELPSLPDLPELPQAVRSGGSIAGIAIGALVGLGLIAAAVVPLLRGEPEDTGRKGKRKPKAKKEA